VKIEDLKFISVNAAIEHRRIHFTFHIIDERTLQHMELKYVKYGRLTYLGPEFVLEFNLELGFDRAANPELWHALKDDEPMMKSFVLARMRGEI